jgi:WD40 repeat protein
MPFVVDAFLRAITIGRFVHVVIPSVENGEAAADGSQGNPTPVLECSIPVGQGAAPVRSIVFSPDASLMVTSAERTIRVWELSSRECKATGSGHEGAVTAVAFSSNGSTIASGSTDRTLRLWELSPAATESGPGLSLACTATLRAAEQGILAVAFAPNGATIAASSQDLKFMLWNVTSKLLTSTCTLKSVVTSIAFMPNGVTVALGSADKTIKLWNVASNTKVGTLMGHTATVTSVAISPDGCQLVSGGDDSAIRVWSGLQGEINQSKVWSGHTGQVRCVAVSPDGALVASCGEDKTVQLWDSTSPDQSTAKWKETVDGDPASIVFSPDGTRLAAACKDIIKIWNVSPGTTVHRLFVHQRRVTFVAVLEAPTNAFYPLLPIVEDDLGKSKVVTHPFLFTADEGGHCKVWRYSPATAAGAPSIGNPLELKLFRWIEADAFALSNGSLVFSVQFSSDGLWIELGLNGAAGHQRLLRSSVFLLQATIAEYEKLKSQVEGVAEASETGGLELRDRRRSSPSLYQHWGELCSLVEALPNTLTDRRIVDPQKEMKAAMVAQKERVERLRGFMRTNQEILRLYPLNLSTAPNGDPAAWPWSKAKGDLEEFSRSLLQLMKRKQELSGLARSIQQHSALGLAVEPGQLELQEKWQQEILELSTPLQDNYRSVDCLLRAGFPELRGRILQIDEMCGRGKLRMDLSLADFEPLKELRPNIFRASRRRTPNPEKALEPVYILKRFLAGNREDFYREMEAMSPARQPGGLAHPNVGELKFGFVEGSDETASYFLAMPEYRCDSTSWFRQRLKEKDREALLRGLVEMTEGLLALHCSGVIHGDLKPDNILFDSDSSSGRPKIIDFNFSSVDQIRTNAVLKVKTAALGASDGFTPPEFQHGHGNTAASRTHESDVFSLGKTWEHLLHLNLLKSTELQAGVGRGASQKLSELVGLMTCRAPEKRIRLGKLSSESSTGSTTDTVLKILQMLKQEVRN